MQSSFQLSIRHLFYATALIASGLAVHPMTIIASIFVLLFWWLVFSGFGPAGQQLIHLLVVVAVLWGVFAMLLPSIRVVRDSSRRAECMNNMRQLMLALYNYESVYQAFPPAQIINEETGKPMHSWRVAILPYMEGQAVYDLYDFDEPWDGPNNSKLVNQMPTIFSCPHYDAGDGMTTYKLISDTGAAFDGDTARKVADIDDGTSTTIAIIEDIKNPINWMKPDDVDIKTAIKILTQDQTHHVPEETVFRRLIFGAHCVTLDGAVVSFDPTLITDAELRSSMLIADGKGAQLSKISSAGARVETKWGAYFGLLIFIGLAIVPAFFVKKNKTPINPQTELNYDRPSRHE